MSTAPVTSLAHAPQAEGIRPTDVTERMNFSDMVAMGDQLVKTGFLPEHIRNGAQFAAIVLDGRERGMAPMRAVRSLQMVKGKVMESADSQLARFKADGGRSKFTRLDDTGAVLWLRHPNGDEHTETWTIDDSKKAGLLGNMHGKFPKAMFRSRAIAAGLKSVGWEGSVGTFDPDELQINADVTPPPMLPIPTAKVSLDAAAAAAEEKLALIKDISEAYDFLEVPTAERKAFTARILGREKPDSIADLRTIFGTLDEMCDAKEKADEAKRGPDDGADDPPSQPALIDDDADKR